MPKAAHRPGQAAGLRQDVGGDQLHRAPSQAGWQSGEILGAPRRVKPLLRRGDRPRLRRLPNAPPDAASLSFLNGGSHAPVSATRPGSRAQCRSGRSRRTEDDPKEIIQKAIAAHGGADNLNKYKAFRSSAKGTINIPQLGQEMEFTSESVFQAPDKMKSTFKAELMGNALTFEQKIIGDKSSLTVNGMDMPIPDEQKAELKNTMMLQKVMTLTPLLTDKNLELKALGSSKIDGKDAVGVAVTGKDVKEIKLFFDKTSHLLVKTERMGMGPMGGEVKQEATLSDYKDYNGVKKPTKVVIMHDGKKFMESNTTEQKLLEKIDDKEFSD